MPSYDLMLKQMNQSAAQTRKALSEEKRGQQIVDMPIITPKQPQVMPLDVAAVANTVTGKVVDFNQAKAKMAMSNYQDTDYQETLRQQQRELENNTQRSYQIDARPNPSKQLTPEQLAQLMAPKKPLGPAPTGPRNI